MALVLRPHPIEQVLGACAVESGSADLCEPHRERGAGLAGHDFARREAARPLRHPDQGQDAEIGGPSGGTPLSEAQQPGQLFVRIAGDLAEDVAAAAAPVETSRPVRRELLVHGVLVAGELEAHVDLRVATVARAHGREHLAGEAPRPHQAGAQRVNERALADVVVTIDDVQAGCEVDLRVADGAVAPHRDGLDQHDGPPAATARR
ncbi:hypothetical protein WMF46_17340 [Sorangium sp. So ce117]